MASSSELFDLIKSLTSNEKRYFQLQTSLQTGTKNYALLFEEIDLLDVYNKDIILERLKDYKFVKSLHVTENYLYQKIMESLRTFHVDKSIDAQLSNLLFEAEILKNKGFYKLSMDSLKRAEKIAAKYHKQQVIATIILRKIDLIVADSRKLLLEQLDELYQQSKTTHQQLEQELEYTYLHHWFLLIFRKIRNPKNEDLIQQMEAHYLNIAESPFPEQGSFNSQYYHYTIQSIYFQIIHDYENGAKMHEKILGIWEANPNIIKERLAIFIARLANYINNSLTCNNFDLVYSLIEKMEALCPQTFDEAGEQFQNIYFYKQLYFLNSKQWLAAKQLIPEIEKGLYQYHNKINPARKLSFYYNSTITFFLLEEYESASNWLNKILSITRTDEPRKDVQRFARILQLAIYYKLSSHDVLEYMFRSVYRNKQLKEEMHLFEKTVLKYFKKLLHIPPHSKEEKQLFDELKKTLSAFNLAEKKTTGFEEFYIWVDMMSSSSLKSLN